MSYIEYFTIVMALGHIVFAPLVHEIIKDVTGQRTSATRFFVSVLGIGTPIIGAFIKFATSGPLDPYAEGTNLGFYLMILIYIAFWLQVALKHVQNNYNENGI